MATTLASNDTDEHEKTATQENEKQKYISQVSWKALFGFTTRQHMPVLIGGVLSAFIAALTMPIFAVVYGLIFREYTDYGAGKTDSNKLMSNINKHCIILTGIATVTWIANSVNFFFFLTFGELQARSARQRMFNALIQKDMTWYDIRETGVAAFLPTVQSHIRDLQLAVSAPLGEGMQSIIMGIVALGVALYYSWNLTLIIMCTLPLLYLVQSYISHRLSLRTYDQAEELKLALKYITTAIQSIETVKCFNGERYELQTFTNIGFWYGSYLVQTGNKTSGQVLTTFWAALMAISGITSILPQFIVLQKGKAAGAQLGMLVKQISTSDQNLESQGQTKPARCPGDIEFKQVTFSYPTRPDEIAIRDASLFIPAGDTTFVIGKSGSGKSTLGQLLARFYRPSSGQILLNGIPLHDLDVHWLRENVTLVEQHSVLFNDTIRHNLALGKLGNALSMQEVQDAVNFAMLEPVIQDLPDGLDADLGMKGNSLSGGQKQRMALARARIRNAPVLILDESTSALDYITRAQILEGIRKWRKGKTTVVITHDISQIQPEDFLYLMENARVVQEGYRKELESQDGAFQTFLESHEEREDDEETDDDDDLSYIGNETDKIISLYEDSRNVHSSPMRRPLSAVLFGQSVLQPFIRKPRESWAGIMMAGLGIRRRLSEDEEDENQHSGRSSMHVAPGAPKAPPGISSLKAPPDMPSSAPGAFKSRDFASRQNSMSSRHSKSYSHGRPLSYASEYGSQRSSAVSAGTTSHRISYPRPLTVPDSLPVHLETPKNRSMNGKFRTKMGLSRRKGDAEEQTTSDDSLPIKEIFKSIWPAIDWLTRLVLFAAIFCTVVHASCTPVFAWVFAQLLTTFYEPSGQKQQARSYALAILGIAVTDGTSSYLMFFCADSVAQSWTLALKTEAMKRILMQPREFFDKEENSMPRLAQTLDHFAEEARNLPGRFACVFLVIIIMIFVSVTWSLIISWKLALVALATSPILYGITTCSNMISVRWERLANEADDNVGQVLHETFVNIRTVRSLVLEGHFQKKYNDATTAAVNVGIKRAIYSGSVFGLTFTGVIFVAILLFWYGGYLIAHNVYTVNAIMETFLVLMLSINHVSYMAHYVTQVNMSRDAGSRLLRLARLPTTSDELAGSTQIQTAGDIVLKNVNFRYPSRQDVPVLQNVSFSIPQGSCTAIVGSSGSGKSTIAALLLKLYQTDAKSFWSSEPAGGMTVSDYDIKTLHTTTLRSRMAIVPQTPILFPGTIAENIAYGLSPSAPEATIECVKVAAAAAGVAEFIDSLPQGYSTLIGEGGTALSGGQAQRLSIARALVRNPDILILDEATSALDVASANIIRDTIRKLVHPTTTTNTTTTPTFPPESPSSTYSPTSPSMSPRSRSGGFWDNEDWGAGFVQGQGENKGKKQMTVIIITHAREMMTIAEHIVMLDKGRVIEEGTFRALKKKRGGAFGRLLRGERD
ncbi:multidrug resistance protein 2 [Clathrospora elynae]|uniref:Multidrug resistance protein 2 n=1 Tax=Clathrospora elynae TaxID=706981 RepID=A0A6A5SPB8_9PLEO|nr:multidrug resistance protein 2 [Clathrospora elynae]